MQFAEQKITTGKIPSSLFLKFLVTPGSIGRLKSLLTTRPSDEMSMIDYLERHAEERPDAIAIKFEDRQISWGELNVPKPIKWRITSNRAV